MRTQKKDIKLYMFLRLLILFSVLLSLVLYQRSGFLTNEVIVRTYFVTFFTFLLTTAFLFMLEKTEKVKYFLSSQVAYDVLFTSVLIFYAGPFESVYGYFYVFNIIFAALLLGSKESLLTAILSSGFYALLYWLSGDLGSNERTFSLLISVTAFIAISLLTSQFLEELKRSRQKIRKLEELSEEIVNSLDSGLLGIDQDGNVQKINRTAETFLGIIDLEQVYGKRYDQVFPFLKGIHQSEVKEILIQGKRRRVLINKVDLPEQNYMILLRDLTEILILEEKVRRQERLAGVGQLAAGLAHEIRNPIAAISGSAQLLISDPSSNKENLLAIVLREIDRVDRLVTQLLRFSKSSRNDKLEINLADLLSKTIESYQTRADVIQNRIEIFFECDRSKFEAFKIMGDADEVLEVLNNLLTNAIQSFDTISSNKLKKIEINLKKTTSSIELEVKDNGIGIPEAFRERVFDPFFTTKSGGTGLGLSQVYRILRDHQANLDFETEEGNGSTFRIHWSI